MLLDCGADHQTEICEPSEVFVHRNIANVIMQMIDCRNPTIDEIEEWTASLNPASEAQR